ncbi:MAG: hypothetical protein VW362_04350, partial [Candidatus Nanopelagicales bacterium]
RGELPPVPREWVRRENKWRATRWGVEADLVVDDAGNTKPLVEIVRELVDQLMPVAQELECTTELGYLLDITESGPSYLRQRAMLAEGAGFEDVVEHLRHEMLNDVRGSAST